MQDIYSIHLYELSRYPKLYTLEMAKKNNDIITYGAATYNTKQLLTFINNIKNNIPDKVVIRNYGIDLEYPKIGILQYNGELINYTVRYYNDTEFEYLSVYGYDTTIRIRDTGYGFIKDYGIYTLDNNIFYVFHEPIINK